MGYRKEMFFAFVVVGCAAALSDIQWRRRRKNCSKTEMTKDTRPKATTATAATKQILNIIHYSSVPFILIINSESVAERCCCSCFLFTCDVVRTG